MENPEDFQSPPNQTQHNPGPMNAGRNASTLPDSECGEFQTSAQAQLRRLKPRKRVARGAIVKAKALPLDLNAPPVLYKCVLCEKPYDKLRAICGHMKKHRNRPWKGIKPPSTWESLNLNRSLIMDEDSEI